MRIWFIILFGVLVAASGCKSSVSLTTKDANHIVALKGDGYTYPVKITDDLGNRIKTGSDYEATKDYTQNIVDNFRASGKDTMLIFIHGGLNNINVSINRAIGKPGKRGSRLIDSVYAQTDYYPVFLNWESGLGKTLGNQIFRIRRGVDTPWVGALSSPFYIARNLVVMMAKAPYTLGKDVVISTLNNSVASQDQVDIYDNTFISGNDSGHIYLGSSPDHRFFKNTYRNATYVVPGLVSKAVFIPIVDQFGKVAWDNMLRRTQIVFDAPLPFHDFKGLPKSTLYNEQRQGGFNIFINQLKNTLSENSAGEEKTIILVGHSMGAIVISELLKRHPDLPVSDIVFMAAASTINDFNDSIVPYLQKHEETKFYNLTLHPIAERRENFFYDVSPRGSLLEWIDKYYADAKTFNDLTLGKWNNAIKAFKDFPKEIRDQVYLKGFGIADPQCIDPSINGSYGCPTEHGNFSEMPFWNRKFWIIPNTKD